MLIFRQIYVEVSSYANRGNVAVICWNTLNAATWYVTEEVDGKVSLGKDSQTLLAINFVDFTTKNGDLKEIEEVTVSKIDDRQLIIGASNVDFADEFQKAPKKDGDQTSYKTTKVVNNE